MTPDEIIAHVKDLPVVSETARKLTIQLNQPTLHRDELVRTVRCDHVLTAKLLRVCNSAQTGLKAPVVSIDQALLLLGDESVFRMVCALGFGGAVGMSAPGYATEANGLWIHSLTTAVGAEHLAKNQVCGDFPPSVAFTAGLLHDIGKSVINKILTPKTRTNIRQKITSEGLSRTEAEKHVLGADHSEIGACLLKSWSLPDPIIEAVANHHHPIVEPELHLSALVYLANTMAHLAKTSSSSESQSADILKVASKVLGFEEATLEEIILKGNTATANAPELRLAA